MAADANVSGQTYPDQSLYPSNSGPTVARRINNALLRADQIGTAHNLTTFCLPVTIAHPLSVASFVQ